MATAIEAVLRAGEIQMQHFGAIRTVEKKGTIDLVTEVDVEVETMFRRMIGERFPDHEILAEELSEPGAGRAHRRHRWVFDPIDGTTNYAHGLPIFCASLALEVDGALALAAVHDPSRKELFTAEQGRGAFLNGVPIRVSTVASIIDAVLCTGFPYNVHEILDEIVGLFRDFVGRARGVRRLGSAALDLCYVAAGRLDGFWERGLHPWDIGAGALLVQEAGGRVTRYDGGPFDPYRGDAIASNGAIHDEMIDIVRAFAERRSRIRTS